jgi:hypothetical protein
VAAGAFTQCLRIDWHGKDDWNEPKKPVPQRLIIIKASVLEQKVLRIEIVFVKKDLW